MTVRNRASGACTYRATMLSVSLLGGLLFSGLALPACANSGSVGAGARGMGSLSGGHIGMSDGMRQRGSIFSLHEHQMHFRHGHHRDRDLFADSFFPFGFGWPISEPDLGATADDSGVDDSDSRRPPFWHVERYEPPTVEKTPSGVTIIRGPGSHHGVSPY